MKRGWKSRYSEELKAEAIRLCQIAKSLGIGQTALNRCVRESLQSSAPANKEATEELKALREEVRRLKMEHEILKKAAAFFAKNQQ